MWEGIKETFTPPNSCVQIRDTMFPGFSGAEMWNSNTPISEDCLYLNVVVPATKPKNAPVLVWIHGGGFYYGTSTLDMYDMKELAVHENIIMVSMQYRLASLGFLCFNNTGDSQCNAGLFDQRIALQWVKDNIVQFGGNPDNVTIAGEDAGAASVGHHILSTPSHHLFNQAILQSGSAFVPWSAITLEKSIPRGLRLAELMGCQHQRSEIQQAVDCLRRKNATDLVNREWDGIVYHIAEFPFVPVVDGKFLLESPNESMKSKNFKPCNILAGSNQDQGYYFLLYYFADIFKLDDDVFVTREDFDRMAEDINLHFSPFIQDVVKHEYTDWSSNGLNETLNRQALDRMVGDQSYTCPVMDFSHRFSETGNNVYVYHFEKRSSVDPWPAWSGVRQGSEIPFIFGHPFNKSKNYEQAEVQLSQRIMTYWGNFVKTG